MAPVVADQRAGRVVRAGREQRGAGRDQRRPAPPGCGRSRPASRARPAPGRPRRPPTVRSPPMLAGRARSRPGRSSPPPGRPWARARGAVRSARCASASRSAAGPSAASRAASARKGGLASSQVSRREPGHTSQRRPARRAGPGAGVQQAASARNPAPSAPPRRGPSRRRRRSRAAGSGRRPARRPPRGSRRRRAGRRGRPPRSARRARQGPCAARPPGRDRARRAEAPGSSGLMACLGAGPWPRGAAPAGPRHVVAQRQPGDPARHGEGRGHPRLVGHPHPVAVGARAATRPPAPSGRRRCCGRSCGPAARSPRGRRCGPRAGRPLADLFAHVPAALRVALQRSGSSSGWRPSSARGRSRSSPSRPPPAAPRCRWPRGSRRRRRPGRA